MSWFKIWRYGFISALVVWILLLPWQTHYVYSDFKIYAFDVWWVVLVITFIGYWYTHRELKPDWSWFWLGMAVITVGLVSGYWANDRDISLYYWLHLVAAISVAWMMAMSRISHVPLFWALLATGWVQTILLFWQWCQQRVTASTWLGMAEQLPANAGVPVVLTTAGRWLRPFGSFPHPNITAGWLVVCLLAGTCLWLSVYKHWQRRVLLISNSVLTLGLLLTFSRSAVIVLLSCSLVLLLWQRRLLWPIITPLLLTLVVVIILFHSFWFSRVTATDYVERTSITTRVTELNQSWSVIQTYWPRGIGIGNYPSWQSQVVGEPVEPVHVVLLLLTAELGVLGTVVWLIWLVSAYLPAIHQARRHIVSHLSPEIAVLTLLSLSMFLLGFFDHYTWTMPSLLFVWMLLLGMQRSSNN